MTRRTWSWIIGGGFALLALLAIVTTVPVSTQPAQSQPIDLHATSSDSGAPPCATMRLTGELESQKKVPLVDVWGLSQVTATIVSPVVYVGGEAPCPAGTDVADSMVIVFTPDCESPAILDSEDDLEDQWTWPYTRCGGAGWALLGRVGDESYDATTSYYEGQRYPLAESGVVVADRWCLDTQFGVGLVEANTSTSATLDEVEGDLCIDLA